MSALAIIGKDLRILTRDRRAVMVLVVMPMVFIAILGFSTGQLLGFKDENAAIRLAWVSRSDHVLVETIRTKLAERPGVQVSDAPDESTAHRWVDDADVTAAVYVGPKFDTQIAALSLGDVLQVDAGALADGLGAIDIVIHQRPTERVLGDIVEQLVYSATMRALVPHIARQDPITSAYLRTVQSRSPASQPAEAVHQSPSAAGSGPASMVYQIIVPSYAVLFAFFLINIMARSFIAERGAGTLRRLHAAPISPAALLLGKTGPFFLISFVQGVLLLAFGRVLFGMSWGSHPFMLLPVVACTSLAATALGLLTAVLVRTDAQVSAYANLLVITLGGLSGCFMPRAWLPESVRTVSLAIPHAWSLIAYDQLLNSAQPNLVRVVTCCGVLTLFAAAFFVAGWLRFRRSNPALAE